ncbi:hypothetical protein PanWU01x14_287450, partial [Parasponia andersonii]
MTPHHGAILAAPWRQATFGQTPRCCKYRFWSLTRTRSTMALSNKHRNALFSFG